MALCECCGNYLLKFEAGSCTLPRNWPFREPCKYFGLERSLFFFSILINPRTKLSSPPSLTGSAISLVSVVQARNNARVLICGSLDLFSNRFLRYGVLKSGSSKKHDKSGNEQFVTEISKWVFHERGHLKVFSVEIYEWSGSSWRPYVADDVQVQFYMMSPYVLKNLPTDEKALYFTSFKVPDVYGVFNSRIGDNNLKSRSLVIGYEWRRVQQPLSLACSWSLEVRSRWSLEERTNLSLHLHTLFLNGVVDLKGNIIDAMVEDWQKLKLIHPPWRGIQIEEMGIVYAHRNEDIVNMGLEYERKHDSSFRNERIISKLSCQEDSIEKSCAREQKKNEFIKIAQYSGTIEVMGLMQGKIEGDTFIVMDAFALPVEGTDLASMLRPTPMSIWWITLWPKSGYSTLRQ
ncbi:hypothetical protein HPP92_010239 [Vanilla planifolia]|uniref:Dolichyl-diphosphooligosaccharide--protein glycosyltransferase 48 kDa subunit n=1 Tax=Vanilla planifolia TaxID=51239 RepID=A0A835V188_VANPL|nr:hypothetical protein HPP92_010239 [Vanilla planifolia]